jgi:hypothetical protein
MGLHKIQSMYTSKERITRIKKQPTERKSLLVIHWIKDKYPEYKKSLNIKHKSTNNLNHKWANELYSFDKKNKWPVKT